MRIKVICIMLLVSVFSITAIGEVFGYEGRWDIRQGAWTGYWHVDANKKFEGSITTGAQTIDMKGRVLIDGNKVAARVKQTDGNDCIYWGTISQRKATGTYNCRNHGGGHPWHAFIPTQ
jgi:hypothetical protein